MFEPRVGQIMSDPLIGRLTMTDVDDASDYGIVTEVLVKPADEDDLYKIYWFQLGTYGIYDRFDTEAYIEWYDEWLKNQQ
jgi:hypothetical protein